MPPSNDPGGLDDLIAALRGLDGEVVVGIDVVGSFARFLEATLLAEGFTLVHAPGIAVNRAGQSFAGDQRKSGPRDARTIAELVRTRDLRTILPDDDTRVALQLKVGRPMMTARSWTPLPARRNRGQRRACGTGPRGAPREAPAPPSGGAAVAPKARTCGGELTKSCPKPVPIGADRCLSIR